LARWPVRTQVVDGVVASFPFGPKCRVGLSESGFQQRDAVEVLIVQSGAGARRRSARAGG